MSLFTTRPRQWRWVSCFLNSGDEGPVVNPAVVNPAVVNPAVVILAVVNRTVVNPTVSSSAEF